MQKNEAQKELEEYRKTKIAYLSDSDKNMDFSKCDNPKKKLKNDSKRSDTKNA